MRPRITFLSQTRLGTGGVEKHVLQTVEQLQSQFEFYIVGPIQSDFMQAAARLCSPERLITIPKYAKTDLRGVYELARILKSTQADIVHTQDPRARLLGHPAAKFSGAATVHTFHMSPLYYETSGLRRQFDMRLEAVFNRFVSDYLIFVSSLDRQLYSKLELIGQERNVVVHNGIEIPTMSSEQKLEARERMRSRLGLREGDMLISTVGRLSTQKGVDYFLESISRLVKMDKGLKFKSAVAGDGPLRRELEELAQRLGIADHVVFLGRLDSEEINDLLAASDIFVLSSRYECFPYAILEAISFGLPCVVSDVGGNAEMVEDGVNGLVFEKGDVERLTRHIQRLLREPDTRERFGKESRTRVQRYSVEQMAASTAAVYRQVLKV